MAQVFVSHATEDAATARRVVDALKAAGIGIWIAPDSIPPGTAYNEAIVAGLRASETLFVLVSKAANASKHVAREVALADDHGKRIVPIRIEPVEPSDGLTYYLSLPQWVEWHSDGVAALAPVIALLGKADERDPPLPVKREAPVERTSLQHVAPGARATLRIHRAKALAGSMRKLAILLDGQKIGEIGNDETVELHVGPGRHDLAVRIDYIKSEAFAVDVAAGETANLTVGAAELSNFKSQVAGLLGQSSYFKWTRVD